MGMSACVRGHPQTVLLARPPCAEDCIWPPGGHNPVLRTWKRSTIGGEKGPRTSSSAGTWPGPGRFISQPGFLGDGFLSFFFFLWLHSYAPWGAFFTHCEAQLSGGTFAHVMRLSWEPLRWKTPNKVRPVAEAWLFLVCVFSMASHLLAPRH